MNTISIRGAARKAQKGVALVVALLLLLTMTIIGVGTLAGTHMQERMAGNAYVQSQAFEAASIGVASSLSLLNNLPAPCTAGTPDAWFGDWTTPVSFGAATLRQRLYCLPFFASDDATSPTGFELFVLNRGEVTVDGQVVALRDVEVRVGRFGGAANDPCNGAAMCFPLQPDWPIDPNCGSPAQSGFCACAFPGRGNNSTNPFEGFSSNAFSVVGQALGDLDNGPAIAFSPNLRLAFECAVTGGRTADECETAERDNQGRCARLGNYVGGFETVEEFLPPWSDPVTAFEFVNELYALRNVSGANITYVEGNHSMGGNTGGSGIIVVEGNLEWNGTPQFDGLIIVLGGTFNVAGGGTGGDGAGSVVVVGLEPKPSQVAGGSSDPPAFTGSFEMNFSGGGTAGYQFGCAELWDAWENLGGGMRDGTGQYSEAQQLWTPNCDPEGGVPAGATDGIVSWRENIGWRAEDFPGAAD
jgi:hypothetical protein